MNVAIPPEFEALARKMVDCGTFASVDEAVAAALHDQASRIVDLRSEIEKGIASLDRGAGLDADTAMRDLIVKTRARYGG